MLLRERQADSLLQLVRLRRVFENYGAYLPGSLYAAWAHHWRDEPSLARTAFEAAQVFLDSVVRERSDDWRVHSARGLALAGPGRREEALREAGWLQRSAAYREDAFDGPWLAEDRAKILAQVGDADEALKEIERLLAKPSWLSVHTLRLDPLWNPIRNDPRFQTLLTRYPPR